MNHTTDRRATLLHTWICQQYEVKENSFSAVSGDASFRRYFRFIAKHADGKDNVSLIAVDAPPELENSQPFIDVACLLEKNNIPVPKIYQQDLKQGFYIQQDFGDTLLLDILNAHSSDALYKQAMHYILDIQKVSTEHLPLYDSQLLQKEMNLFSDWFIKKHLNLTLSTGDNAHIQTCFKLLEANALEQPQVFVHRDYHSRNLMVLDDNSLGIIDFQDAVKGPITYDLVSLLRDCYIAWPQMNIDQWLKHFYQKLNCEYTLEQFTRWFDLMGVQRHLKATGIFCRLNYRDHKSSYLNDIPRTLNYIVDTSKKYSELSELNKILSKLS